MRVPVVSPHNADWCPSGFLGALNTSKPDYQTGKTGNKYFWSLLILAVINEGVNLRGRDHCWPGNLPFRALLEPSIPGSAAHHMGK